MFAVKNNTFNRQCFSRLFSTFFSQLNEIKEKIVILSQSHDIFTNLALEDFIYSKTTFKEKGMILLVWRSNPCVVIGRHQNPWQEVMVDNCNKNNITVCRRNSGGGTVFHDLGNINMSFLSSKENYNRKNNLQFISSCLLEKFKVKTVISPREDLVLESGEKVSGTASKLASKNSYHHCTLVVNVNLDRMRSAIRKDAIPSLKSNATTSVRSPVKNLQSISKEMNAVNCMDSIVDSFVNGDPKRIMTINPVESVVPGIQGKTKEFSSWDWIFGKTPRFYLEKELNGEADPFTLKMTIIKGCVSEFSCQSDSREGLLQLDLKDVRFEPDTVQEKLLMWSLLEDDIIWSNSVIKAASSLIKEVF